MINKFFENLPSDWEDANIPWTDKVDEDYHVMALVDNEVESVKFECYNSPHEPEKLENITKLVEISIERCLKQEEELRRKENEKNI